MSFILEALRKSEHERQQGARPGIVDVRSGHRQTARWIWPLAILLALNVAGLSYLLLRPSVESSPDNPPVASSPLPLPPAAPAERERRPQTVASPRPTPVQSAEATPREVRPLGGETRQRSSATAPVPAEAPAASTPPIAVAPAAPAGDESVAHLPSIDALRLQGRNLPELHLDVHVYARDAGDRFVFVNTRKYREGEQLSEGFLIERIVREGVVLSRDGERFLLPRD